MARTFISLQQLFIQDSTRLNGNHMSPNEMIYKTKPGYTTKMMEPGVYTRPTIILDNAGGSLLRKLRSNYSYPQL